MAISQQVPISEEYSLDEIVEDSPLISEAVWNNLYKDAREIIDLEIERTSGKRIMTEGDYKEICDYLDNWGDELLKKVRFYTAIQFLTFGGLYLAFDYFT